MLKISELLPQIPAYTIFINAFISKKYVLPFQVIDALVYHYYNFINHSAQGEALLIIWYEGLVNFIKVYGEYMSEEQRGLLKDLAKKIKHPKFTHVICNEISKIKGQKECIEDINPNDEGAIDLGTSDDDLEMGNSNDDCIEEVNEEIETE